MKKKNNEIDKDQSVRRLIKSARQTAGTRDTDQ